MSTLSELHYDNRVECARLYREMLEEIKKKRAELEKSEYDMLLEALEVAHKKPMTAKEISAESGLSIHEVAGNFCALGHGWSRYQYLATYKDGEKHDSKIKVAVTPKKIVHHFAEVDENGEVIKGGKSFERTEIKNLYKYNGMV